MAKTEKKTLSRPLKSMQSCLMNLIRKKKMLGTKIVWTRYYVILVKLSSITIKKCGIISKSALSQKTCFSHGNLFVSDQG